MCVCIYIYIYIYLYPSPQVSSATPLQLAGTLSSFRDTMRGLAIRAKKPVPVPAEGDLPPTDLAPTDLAPSSVSAGAPAGPVLAGELAGDVLRACDDLRDLELPSLGLRIEDRPSGEAQFALDDPKLVLAEAARRKEAAIAAEAQVYIIYICVDICLYIYVCVCV